MKRSCLEEHRCPACRSNRLALNATTSHSDGEIVDGSITCESCGRVYPIMRGLPRFVTPSNYAESFGFQWNVHARTQLDSHTGLSISHARLWAAIGGKTDLHGQRVLEAGSGAGRFTEVLARSGADVVSFDYSTAVDANARNNLPSPHLHLFQGDIFNIPLAEGSFDKVVCLGVLQHTPDPHAAFRSLAKYVRPGGQLVIDAYTRSVTALLHWKYLLRPITRRMGRETLYRLIEAVTPPLIPAARILRRAAGRAGARLLPIVEYSHLGLPPELNTQWAILDTFDMYSPAHDHPQSLATVKRWFEEAGFEDIEVRFGQNGVVGSGTRPLRQTPRASMKIVINALSARLGGGQTYLKNLLAHLPDQPELDLLVYAPRSLNLPEDRRIRRGRTVWPTDNPLLRSAWEMLILPRILARERAAMLFCPGGLISTRPPAGCRTVTMFRNMMPFDKHARHAMPFGLQRLRNWMLEHLMLASMAKADLTIFISDFARHVIEARIRMRQALTIPHGIATAFRTQGKTIDRPARLPRCKYLLYVSKFDSYKHHSEVVRGFAKLPRELQQQYALVLVGGTDHPSAAQVEAIKDRCCVPGSVQMLGAVPYAELPAFYHHAEAILFASSCENCPNILLEALASGRPVLSSNVMPMPEFGGRGIEYFSPFDPDDIARALQCVLTNPQRAREVAASALAESRRFDWSDSAARTWEAMSRLACEPARRTA